MRRFLNSLLRSKVRNSTAPRSGRFTWPGRSPDRDRPTGPATKPVLLRILSVLGFAALLAACTLPGSATPAPARSATAALPAPRATSGGVQLLVAPSPDGAQVIVDGFPHGASPITLTLPPGDHLIALSAAGYAPFSETITLEAGGEATYAPDLEDIEPPVVRLTPGPLMAPWQGQTPIRVAASDNAGVVDLELALDEQTLVATEGEEIAFEFAPATLPGLAPGRVYTLTATALDAAGNAGQAILLVQVGPGPTPGTPSRPTAAPTAGRTTTPAPAPTAGQTTTPTAGPATPRPSPVAAPTVAPTRAPAVSFRVTQVTIPTYPYRPYLRATADGAMGGYETLTLDRAAYEAANPRPAPVSYTVLILENRYLRLSILPGLGGRIYEVIFKPTGNNELYRNPVIKPTQWGPPSPPYPAGANWWLAAGGIEWGFPVEEHGYEWGKEWGYDSARLPDGGMMVTLVTGDHQRPYATVNVVLPPDAAYFTITPTITNPTAAAARVKWWANAMLAPGAANAPGPELRFILPVNEVTIHSTGDPTLPGPGQPMAWPVHAGRDMSRLGNWAQYLGFFARPAAAGDFMGVFDPTVAEGMLRVYPSAVARGAKGFAMGWGQSIGSDAYTDDKSGYVELHGGLAPTFDDWATLPAGGSVSWTETWYPVADIAGVTFASAAGALSLTPTGDGLRVGLFPLTAVRGELRIALPGVAPIVRPADISPALPFDEVIALPSAVPAQGPIGVTLVNAQGQTIFAYQGTARLRQ